MLGNVAEWCHDTAGPLSDDEMTDPVAPETGGWRILRGGQYSSDPMVTRAAFRSAKGTQSRRGRFIGARLARSVL